MMYHTWLILGNGYHPQTANGHHAATESDRKSECGVPPLESFAEPQPQISYGTPDLQTSGPTLYRLVMAT
jgi:hypothetical protein